MAKFIEVHNHIINIESISKVEFISDDIFLGDFPLDSEGDPQIDFLSFTFAKLELVSGEVIDMNIDLYWPEDGESQDNWYEQNRLCIKISWKKLKETLDTIVKITDYEYELYELKI